MKSILLLTIVVLTSAGCVNVPFVPIIEKSTDEDKYTPILVAETTLE